MELLQAVSVTKKFAETTALSQVSISVPKGSIYGLLGPNGAGKTTLIRIINNIIAPDDGEIIFMGEKLNRSHTAHIGYLPEERGLYKKMKVGEQALYLSQLKGLSHKEAMKALKYWFEKFEIQSWWGKRVEELSKGMQQKIQFIITVIHNPELLIFDEPFSGFDPINVNLIKEEILELKKKGVTIIFSTHNMSSVEELCDHISLVNKSHIILEGSVRNIKDTYKSNIYEIRMQGLKTEFTEAMNSHYHITDIRREEDTVTASIKIPDDSSVNELLQVLMPLGQIKAVNEVIPHMNDIFIQHVNSANENIKN